MDIQSKHTCTDAEGRGGRDVSTHTQREKHVMKIYRTHAHLLLFFLLLRVFRNNSTAHNREVGNRDSTRAEPTQCACTLVQKPHILKVLREKPRSQNKQSHYVHLL